MLAVKVAAKYWLQWTDALRRHLLSVAPPATWQEAALKVVDLVEVKHIDEIYMLAVPVETSFNDTQLFREYKNIVGHPMDLQKIKSKLRGGSSYTKARWKEDMMKIADNCRKYNKGIKNMQKMAKRYSDVVAKELKKLESGPIWRGQSKRGKKRPRPEDSTSQSSSSMALSDKLSKNDVAIDSRVAMLNVVLQDLKNDDRAHWFLEPVSRTVKDYHKIILSPMDISTVEARLSGNKYKWVSRFIYDVELI